MDASFWHQRWETNEIGFHKTEINPLLVKHFKELSLKEDSGVFLPLCGKTLDIAWLLSNGYRIVGAELSEVATKQLFRGLEVEPLISKSGGVIKYSATNINIFVGDLFHMSSEILGPVDAIYDRAALVALPKEIRSRYTTHIRKITGQAPQLLICFEYDQTLMEGPPFSVSREEVYKHYRDSYDLTLVESTNVTGGLKGICEAKESVWLLKNKGT